MFEVVEEYEVDERTVKLAENYGGKHFQSRKTTPKKTRTMIAHNIQTHHSTTMRKNKIIKILFKQTQISSKISHRVQNKYKHSFKPSQVKSMLRKRGKEKKVVRNILILKEGVVLSL